MADNDTPQQDRTEQPSAKRLDDARTRGEVPRSRELALKVPREALLDAGHMQRALLEGLSGGMRLVLPIATVTIVAAFAGSMALGGWSFSTEALTPKFSRLNPIAGFGRLLSMNGLV